MKRLAVLLLLFAAVLPAPPAVTGKEYLQAVEFPYYLYPRTLWERELVWLKNIGIHTVEFSIPWNWHQLQPGDYDFTGRTSPRRDLVSLIKILRRLDMQAWVKPLPPVAGWIDSGNPVGADSRAQRAWLKQLENLLATQTARHGGPIAFVEGRALAIDAAPPPAPVAIISATDPQALARSREAIATPVPTTVLWTNVEDALYPGGWSSDGAFLVRHGAVGLSGDERPAAMALRRNAALLRQWSPLLSGLRAVTLPKPAGGKLPSSLTVKELVSPAASAISITNHGTEAFHDDLRVLDPATHKTVVVASVTVPAGESLWLPLHVSLGPMGLCRECSQFSGVEHIVSATSELLAIEFENGILAMEFAAPVAGEMVLQLARKPVGPYLASGKPTEFDWDERTMRARFQIPASSAAGNRVRIGLAIEEPETSAFFNDARRLVIGRKNTLSTTYSSAEVAARSRLRLPPGYTAVPTVKSPTEIDFDIAVPADGLHGDSVSVALETDGVLLGRAHVQLFRPVSIRLMEAIQLHFGTEGELTPDPPLAPVDPRAGTNLELSIRNNQPGIETYSLEASGEGLDILPAKTEITVGALEERRVPIRIFAKEGVDGVRLWQLRVRGAATLDLPMQVVLLPRNRTVAWSADLDGDGSMEWILESQKTRAVFSAQDGGRWMEFNWKDTNLNFLPERGVWQGLGPVEVHASGDALEFTGKGWKRSVRLVDSTLTMEQSGSLPADGLRNERRGNLDFRVEHPTAGKAIYSLR